MAELSEETTTAVFNLQRRLLQISHQVSAAGFTILQQFGETDATIPDLDILQNVKEQVRVNYTRLSKLLFEISESPQAANFVAMDLLKKPIQQAQAFINDSEATIQEVKRNWNLQIKAEGRGQKAEGK